MIASHQPLTRESNAGASNGFVVKLLSLDRGSWMDGVFPPASIGCFGSFFIGLSLAFQPLIFPLFVIGVIGIFVGIALAFARYAIVVHRTHSSTMTTAS